MYVYQQKNIDNRNLNKAIKTNIINTDNEYHITAEDLALMFISSTIFSLLIVFLV